MTGSSAIWMSTRRITGWVDHAPEGRTDVVTQLRGNVLAQAAKCMVIMVKVGKKEKHYVLGVIPGDAKVDIAAVKALYKGDYASFASADIAEKLSGSVVGTVLPFSFNPELELIVDPSLLAHEEMVFNAARLDRSVYLRTSDYVAAAKPRIEKIVQMAGSREPRAMSQEQTGEERCRLQSSRLKAQSSLAMAKASRCQRSCTRFGTAWRM